VRATVDRDPKELAALADSYRLTGDMPALITVSVDGKKLVAVATLNGEQVHRMELYADTDTSFFAADEGEPVKFSKNKSGQVTAMEIAGAYKAVRIE